MTRCNLPGWRQRAGWRPGMPAASGTPQSWSPRGPVCRSGSGGTLLLKFVTCLPHGDMTQRWHWNRDGNELLTMFHDHAWSSKRVQSFIVQQVLLPWNLSQCLSHPKMTLKALEGIRCVMIAAMDPDPDSDFHLFAYSRSGLGSSKKQNHNTWFQPCIQI